MTKTITRWWVAALVGSMVLAVYMTTASLAQAAEPWTLNAPESISFTCGGGTYNHTLDSVTGDLLTGDFTGEGEYDSNSSYTWDIDGNITGDNIIFTIVYTGSNSGYTLHGSGVIAADGSISGTVDNNCQTFSMETGAATNDGDGDGVQGEDDYCPGTVADEWTEDWGTNRWEVQEHDGVLSWWKNLPAKKKGDGGPKEMYPTLEYTYGCSGNQILDLLEENFGSVMNGHHKFGLSTSVLDEFHTDLADGELDGRYLIETVVVPANDADGVDSVHPLMIGTDYVLRARGVANAGDTIDFDAQYSITNRIAGDGWTDDVSGYTSYGTGLLDLYVDSTDIDWGAYDPAHEYEYTMPGTGAVVNFMVNDIYPSNNTGTLYVDIYGQIH